MSASYLNTPEGLNTLNSYLADKSYITGWQPSQADIAVFEILKKSPSSTHPHALRWYNHIQTYKNEKLPGQKTIPDALTGSSAAKSAPAAAPKADDDDVDLFGSDEDDAEADRIREERLKAYADKKAKKPALTAKSSILFDVKPWDDETDMKKMEELVRSIEMEGLVWGASKFVPVCHGINKLQIMCVVEDEKVSIDLLTEKIEAFEDCVQSVDIAAFNKI